MPKHNQILSIDYRLEGPELVFLVDGAPWAKMPAAAFLDLVDNVRGHVRTERRQGDDIYFGIRDLGVPELVRAHRLSKKGLLQEQIAALMGISDQNLRLLYSRGAERGKGDKGSHDAELQKQMTEGHDMVKCRARLDALGRPEPDRFTFLEAWTVKRLLGKGKDTATIAKDLDLDHKDLQAWIAANGDILAVIPERKGDGEGLEL